MFDYLFDSNYKAARDKYNNAKSKRNKLGNIKNDITNDSSSITSINKRIDYIYDDFIKVVKNSNVRSRVSSKLDALKEPYQSSDTNLSTACDYIEAERAYLKRQMDSAETTMENIKNK